MFFVENTNYVFENKHKTCDFKKKIYIITYVFDKKTIYSSEQTTDLWFQTQIRTYGFEKLIVPIKNTFCFRKSGASVVETEDILWCPHSTCMMATQHMYDAHTAHV